jgi:hypothetical protein
VDEKADEQCLHFVAADINFAGIFYALKAIFLC